MKHRLRAVCASLLLLTACEPGGTSADPMVSFAVTPAEATLATAGDTVRLTASGKTASGVSVGSGAAWQSLTPAVVSVDGSGLVRGVGPGTGQVEARLGTRADTVSIRVLQGGVASVRLTPEGATMTSIGDTLAFTAAALDAQGQVLTGAAVAVTSLAPAVVEIVAGGRGVARAAGTARIVASAGGMADTAEVVVAPVVARVTLEPGTATLTSIGDTLQLVVQAFDARGTALQAAATLVSSNAAVLDMVAGGRAVARGAGTARVVATVGTRADTSEVTVAPAATRVTLSPAAATATSLGDTVQFAVQVFDARGNVLAGVPAALASSAPGVLEMVAGNRGVARAAGTARVTAAVGGITATAEVTVAPRVARVTLLPEAPTVGIGDTVHFTVAAADARGNGIAGALVMLTSSNAAVLDLVAQGRGVARAAGSARVIAAVDSARDTAVVTVRPVSVATIQLAPAVDTVHVLQSVVFTATLRDAAGNVLSGRAVTWSSSNEAVARSSGGGAFAGVAPGMVTVRATAEGVTGEAVLHVVNLPVARIEVQPDTSIIQAGQTRQLTYTLYDAAGRVLPRRSVSWGSLRPDVATVDSAGLVTAVAPDMILPTGIYAAVGGKADTVEVRVRAANDVTPPRLIGLSFTPDTVDVSGADGIIEFALYTQDPGSGIGRMHVAIVPVASPGLDRGIGTSQCAERSVASGGNYRHVCRLRIPEGWYPGGEWEVNLISIEDNAGHTRGYLTPELQALNFPTRLFVVTQ